MAIHRNHQLAFHIDDSITLQSWVYMEPDGELIFSEQCTWRAQEKKKASYEDRLFVPAAHFDAVLSQLQRQFPNVIAVPETDAENLLCKLLDRLSQENKVATLTQNGESHRPLRAWLDQATIPYEIVRAIWSEHMAWNGQAFVEVEKIAAFAASSQIKNPLATRAEQILLKRSEKEDPKSSFWFSIQIDNHGTLIFHEAYEYYAYKDDDGREYDYYLTIPAVYFEAVLGLLLRLNPAKHKTDAHADRSMLLIELLHQRIEQGWGRSRRINASITTLQRWLNQEAIPYKLSRSSWFH